MERGPSWPDADLHRSSPVSRFAIVSLCAALALAGAFSSNPALTSLGFGVLAVLVLLLERPGEPPTLLFAASMQWLQVFLPVLSADAVGESIVVRTQVPEMADAAYLGLLSVVAVAIGMRVGYPPRATLAGAPNGVETKSPTWKRLLIAYLAAFAVTTFIPDLTVAFPAATQLLIPFYAFRTVALFLTFYYAPSSRAHRVLATAVLLLEIAAGFGQFFSGFKRVLYVAILATLGRSGQPGRRKVTGAAVLGIALVVLILLWQTIKVEYRAFLNQGSGFQEILVTPEQRFDFVIERLGGLDPTQWNRGFETTIDRIGYLEFFARAIQTVPARIPHQGGRLWGEILPHLLMPRALFPDKPVINDSDRTNEFTGIRVADASEGASIGIGFVGESYIDFGPVFMFLPIVGLGLFFGAGYRAIVRASPIRALGLAFGASFILTFATLVESSSIKIVGGGIISLAMSVLVLRFGGERLWRSLCSGPPPNWNARRNGS